MFAHHAESMHTDQYFWAKRSCATTNAEKKKMRPVNGFKLVICIKPQLRVKRLGYVRVKFMRIFSFMEGVLNPLGETSYTPISLLPFGRSRVQGGEERPGQARRRIASGTSFR